MGIIRLIRLDFASSAVTCTVCKNRIIDLNLSKLVSFSKHSLRYTLYIYINTKNIVSVITIEIEKVFHEKYGFIDQVYINSYTDTYRLVTCGLIYTACVHMTTLVNRQRLRIVSFSIM